MELGSFVVEGGENKHPVLFVFLFLLLKKNNFSTVKGGAYNGF